MTDLGPATRVAVAAMSEAFEDHRYDGPAVYRDGGYIVRCCCGWENGPGPFDAWDLHMLGYALATLAEPRRSQCETCGGTSLSQEARADYCRARFGTSACPNPHCVDGFVTLPPPWQAWVVEQGLEVEWEPNMFRRVPRPTEEEK